MRSLPHKLADCARTVGETVGVAVLVTAGFVITLWFASELLFPIRV